MAGLAGIIHWDQRPVPKSLIDDMLQTIGHRGPDGLQSEVRGGVGFGHAKFILRPEEAGQAQPLWWPDGSCAVVADARLYNRDELLRAFGPVDGPDQAPSDAWLILAAYSAWGPQLLPRLRGDFAFAIWDQARKHLFAARDPFGVKPFFFHADAARFCFASEPRQLLRLPGVSAALDDAVICDYLAQPVCRAFERTFHRDVTRLRAGHHLIATSASIVQQRYWPAASRPERFEGDAPACAARFYSLFEQSVQRRLRAGAQVAIELSGGYDSSAVVLAAEALAARQAAEFPEIFTASLVYPSHECDESEYIAAVTDRVRFDSLQVVAPVGDFSVGLEARLRQLDGPVPEISWERRHDFCTRIRGRGGKVVLTGLGGDDLVWDTDLEQDLWRDGHYLDALRYCFSDPRVLASKAAKSRARRLLLGMLPITVVRVIRRLLGRSGPTPGDGTNNEFAAGESSLLQPGDHGPIEAVGWDHASQTVWRWLASPEFVYLIEHEERLQACQGLESRHPFLDQDLADFVLSIPYRTRLEMPGSFKTLLVAAFAERLPPLVRDRADKAGFDQYFMDVLASGYSGLARLLEAAPARVWTHGLDRDKILGVLSRALPRDPAWFGNVMPFWKSTLAAAWLQSQSYSTYDDSAIHSKSRGVSEL